MSHTPPMPPIPDAAIPPFPAHPAPHAHAEAHAHAHAHANAHADTHTHPKKPGHGHDAPPPPRPTPKHAGAADDRTRLIAGAAVGIGSAAIVAALLYANRKPGKAPRPADPRGHKAP